MKNGKMSQKYLVSAFFFNFFLLSMFQGMEKKTFRNITYSNQKVILKECEIHEKMFKRIVKLS